MAGARLVLRQRTFRQTVGVIVAILLQIGLALGSYVKVMEVRALFRRHGADLTVATWLGREILIGSVLLVIVQILTWRYKLERAPR